MLMKNSNTKISTITSIMLVLIGLLMMIYGIVRDDPTSIMLAIIFFCIGPVTIVRNNEKPPKQ